MKYAILVYETPEDFGQRRDPAKADAYWAGWMSYSAAMNDVTTAGAGLQGTDTATVLRLRGGARAVQDGPYADTREQLGGFYVIDVADLDAALDWAAKCPAAPNGAIEVRPLLQLGA